MDVWLYANDYTWDLKKTEMISAHEPPINPALEKSESIKRKNRNKKDGQFPMLIMQLSHILLQNKTWKNRAGLRVFLLVNNEWTEKDQKIFDSLIGYLRLQVNDIVVVKQPKAEFITFQQIIKKEKTFKQMKQHYFELNQQIYSFSKNTYFIFFALPELPPVEHPQVSTVYIFHIFVFFLFFCVCVCVCMCFLGQNMSDVLAIKVTHVI